MLCQHMDHVVMKLLVGKGVPFNCTMQWYRVWIMKPLYENMLSLVRARYQAELHLGTDVVKLVV